MGILHQSLHQHDAPRICYHRRLGQERGREYFLEGVDSPSLEVHSLLLHHHHGAGEEQKGDEGEEQLQYKGYIGQRLKGQFKIYDKTRSKDIFIYPILTHPMYIPFMHTQDYILLLTRGFKSSPNNWRRLWTCTCVPLLDTGVPRSLGEQCLYNMAVCSTIPHQ